MPHSHLAPTLLYSRVSGQPRSLPEGIAFSQGKRWRTVRLALTTLLGLGLGRKSLEEQIQEEVGCLKKELEMCVET